MAQIRSLYAAGPIVNYKAALAVDAMKPETPLWTVTTALESQAWRWRVRAHGERGSNGIKILICLVPGRAFLDAVTGIDRALPRV